MARSIKDVLKSLDLHDLIPNFEREKITPGDVGALSDSQLESLGVRTLGERHRLRLKCRNTGSLMSRFRERSTPFPKRKKKSEKPKPWTKAVICLADPEMLKTPSFQIKQELICAGLGQKVVHLDDINVSPEEFREVLFKTFPKLRGGGGYEILGCCGHDRKLVPVKGEYTPQNFKHQMGQGKLYVRPIQNKLAMDKVCNEAVSESGLKEECKYCNKLVSLNNLRDHLVTCGTSKGKGEVGLSTQEEIDAFEYDDDDLLYDPCLSLTSADEPVRPTSAAEDELVNRPKHEYSVQEQSTSSIMHPDAGEPSSSTGASRSLSSITSVRQPSTRETRRCAYQTFIDLTNSDYSDDDKDDIISAISETLDDDGKKSPQSDVTLKDLIENYRQNCLDDIQVVIVNRRRLLKSVLYAYNQPGFDCRKTVHVEFVGEEGVDDGGPRREMFRLLMKAVEENMGIFDGCIGQKYFTHDIALLEKKQYMIAGSLVGWSLLHGGPGLPILHPGLYELMCGLKPDAFDNVDIISDVDVREKLSKIANCSSEEQYSIIASDLADWAADRGVTSLYSADIAKKDEVVSALLMHFLFYRSQAEIIQFKAGLGVLWTSVEGFPTHYRPLFTDSGTILTRDSFKNMIEYHLSEEGSNLRGTEEDTLFSFEVYLKDCAEGKTKTSLQDLLVFITGADAVPPLGFERKISVEFFSKQQQLKGLPTSSTCALELHLPRGIDDPSQFRDLADEAIICGIGFGKI